MSPATIGSRAEAAQDGADEKGEEDLTRIGDMAKAFGVTLRALRFYEDRGLIHPLREGTTRLYSRRDKARLKLILLGRRVGFSLREVKQLMDLYDPQGANTRQLRLLLDKAGRQLARLEKQRASIDGAIVELGELMRAAEERLGSAQAQRRLA